MSVQPTLRTAQVTPLPIGSGGSSTTALRMNNMNSNLTMMSVQSAADSKYDPPVPQPLTSPQLVQAFCSGPSLRYSNNLPVYIALLGGACIVYGVITK